jgi:drug/metabolite transporter (DMT)-like permease
MASARNRVLGMVPLFVMVVCNTAMTIFVIRESDRLPQHGLTFAIILASFSAFGFLITCLASEESRKHFFDRKQAAWRWRASGVLGFGWSVNFVFLLVFAGSTPGLLQIILTAMTLPVVIVTSWAVLGARYRPIELLGVAIVFGGALTPVITEPDSEKGTFVDYALFFVGAAAIPISSALTEAVVKIDIYGKMNFKKNEEAASHVSTPASSPVPDAANEDPPKAVHIPVLMFAMNVWITIFTVMWLWVPITNGVDAKNLFNNIGVGFRCVFTLQGGNSDDDCPLGSFFLWMVVLTSAITTFTQALVDRSDSAAFAMMASELSPFIAAGLQFSRVIMGGDYDPAAATPTAIIGLPIVLLGTLIYKVSIVKRGALHHSPRPRVERFFGQIVAPTITLDGVVDDSYQSFK